MGGEGFELSNYVFLRHTQDSDAGKFEGVSRVWHKRYLFVVKTKRGKSGHWHSVMRLLDCPKVEFGVKKTHPVTASNAAALKKWMIKLVERFDQLEYLEDEE